ncbi:uncharacterized protein VK521_017162 isoform 1-T1 [Ammospiza maritima maritima]
MKVAVLSVALLFSILLCPLAQAKGHRMPLRRCPPPKMPGSHHGQPPHAGSWSGSGQWTGSSPQALLEGTQDDLWELDLDNVAVLETPLAPVAKELRALLRQKRLAASLDA